MTSYWRYGTLALIMFVVTLECAIVTTPGDDSVRTLIVAEATVTAEGVTSNALPANPGQGVQCLSYYAKVTGPGKGAGQIRTRLTEVPTGKVISDQDHLTDVVSSQPTLVFFDIPEQKQPFQVVITDAGSSKDATDREISILDAEVRPGACVEKQASCDFDDGMCGYTKFTKGWDVVPPYKDGDTEGYPLLDAADNTTPEKYLKAKVGKSQRNAVIMSTPIESMFSCIRFKYAIYGSGKLVVKKDGSDKPYATYENNDIDLDADVDHPEWKPGQVEAVEGERFRVYFIAVAPESGDESKIALDEIQRVSSSCAYPSPGDIKPDVDCNIKCKNWKSCGKSGRYNIECICKDGFEGDTCERPSASTDPKKSQDDPKLPSSGSDSPKETPGSPATDPSSSQGDIKSPVVDPKTSVKDQKTPVEDPKTPVKDPKSPVVDAKTPAKESKSPVEDPKTPAKESKTPVDDPKTPVEDPKTPAKESKSPVEDPKTPVEDPKTPAKESKSSVEDPESGSGKGAIPPDNSIAKKLSGVETAITAVLVTIVGAVLIIVGTVCLIKKNKLRAPGTIQRMIPYLRSDEGYTNPGFVNLSTDDFGTTNSVFGKYQTDDSGI